ncbi:hypothetical protein RDV89_04670 [Nocardioides zeae]|uniref:Uncharacterized protein n=1 Tax=Nocardioides imazamoxiresistens TaxID=3231893 RepID=A0ABU3PT32_9ACTN|nr:hypothetical protein [Nocardioides zeae]MDT9592346.1 hypothetical protein [Nocardioides zeae]
MNDARSPRDDETRDEKSEESGGDAASRTAGHDHDSAETRGDSEHPHREDR